MTAMSRDSTGAGEKFEAALTRPFTQLIDGEPVVDQPTAAREAIAARIVDTFNSWADARPGRGVARTGLRAILDESNVFAPDVSYLGGDRTMAELIQHMDGPPDLAIELRSLAGWRYNVGPKLRAYEHFGLPELWLVDSPVSSVLVYRRSRPDRTAFDITLEVVAGRSLTSPLLPGFVLTIDDLFAPLGPRY